MRQFDRIATAVAGMLTSEGQSCTVYFQDKEAGDYDPATGTNVPSAPVGVVSSCTRWPLQYESKGDSSYYGTTVEQHDYECYLKPSASFPREPDPTGDYLVEADGTKWRIIVSKAINPSGACVLMHKLLLRR